jgi:hypothetical protein
MADIPEFETFKVKGEPKYGRYLFLKDMPNGAHVHFREGGETALRNAVYLLAKNHRRNVPGFSLSVFKVGDEDPKGPGFRVMRRDREVKL